MFINVIDVGFGMLIVMFMLFSGVLVVFIIESWKLVDDVVKGLKL